MTAGFFLVKKLLSSYGMRVLPTAGGTGQSTRQSWVFTLDLIICRRFYVSRHREIVGLPRSLSPGFRIARRGEFECGQ